MKKILITIFPFIFIGCCSYVLAATDYNQFKADEAKCLETRTSTCFKNLLQKYKRNEVRYNYALVLLNEKKIAQAKMEFENIVRNERKNKKLVELSEKKIQEIENLQKTIRNANAKDYGDYYDELDSVVKWENSYSIKVYIKGSTGKESIFKKAFLVWDNALSKVNFSYVHNEKDADIVCFFVERLPPGEAGVTNYNFKRYNNGEQYFNHATVKVSLYQSGTNTKWTDHNLLGIALHEVGHAIGMQGHSSNKNDIMYYSTETYKNTNISSRDINTVKKIYKN